MLRIDSPLMRCILLSTGFVIRPINPSDLPTIQSWYAHRGLAPLAHSLPPTGFMIDDLAASYLIKTDAKIAISEYTVSNPKAPKELRTEAVKAIYRELIQHAFEEGFDTILAITKISHMESIAEELGFSLYPTFSHYVLEKKDY